MKRATFAILFFIRRTSKLKNSESPIFVRITINGKRADISLKRSIDAKLWNTDKNCVKGNNRSAKEINHHIDNVRSRLLSIANELENNEQLTCSNLKNHFLGKTNKRTILKTFADHNQQCEKLIGIDMAEGTVERYRTSYKHTEEFIKHNYKTDDMPLSEINHQFIKDYEFYLKTERKCAHNTTVKYLKNFNKIIRLALANEWMKSDPFSKIKYKLDKVDKEYLTDEELQRLMDKHFSIDRLEQIKDVFLFCCFTGLAFSDVKSLAPNDIVLGIDGKKWIKKRRQKTKIEFDVPLFEIPLSILKKHENHPVCSLQQKLLPVPSNQKLNGYLKEISDLCGIKKNLSSHSARHTFATTVTLGNGLNLKSISGMMGHSSTKMTEKYARSNEQLICKETSKLDGKYKAS